MLGGAGWGVAPQLGHQPVGGDHPVGAERQDCQEGALLGGSEGDRPALDAHFQGTQEPVFHPQHLPRTAPTSLRPS